MASQAEESPAAAPTDEKELTQNELTSKEEVSTETEQTVSQPNPAGTRSGRGRPPKTATLSAQKKTSVKKEEGSAAQDVPGFKDDPSDTDYTPS